MIPANRPSAQPVRWQQLWREAVTDPHELLQLLGLATHAKELLPEADSGFALRVPRGFVARMRRDASMGSSSTRRTIGRGPAPVKVAPGPPADTAGPPYPASAP